MSSPPVVLVRLALGTMLPLQVSHQHRRAVPPATCYSKPATTLRRGPYRGRHSTRPLARHLLDGYGAADYWRMGVKLLVGLSGSCLRPSGAEAGRRVDGKMGAS
jgi:hypothetical protein